MAAIREDKEFKEQLKKDFILFLQKAIQKEEGHLAFLEKSKKELQKDRILDIFLCYSEPIDMKEIDGMIKYSTAFLDYLQLREKQYIEYAEKI